MSNGRPELLNGEGMGVLKMGEGYGREHLINRIGLTAFRCKGVSADDLRHSLGCIFSGSLCDYFILVEEGPCDNYGYSESLPHVVQVFDRQHATTEASWLSAHPEVSGFGKGPH